MNVVDIIKMHQEPHSSRGLSSCGYGAAKQILDKKYKDFDSLPHGVFEKGKAGHLFFQEKIFRDGEIFKNLTVETMEGHPELIGNIEILGHEQNVYLNVDSGKNYRYSKIDTMVYNQAGWFEVWDYKFKSFFTFKKTKPAQENIEQVNLYCFLSPVPVRKGRLFYVYDSDWTKLKVYTFEPSKKLFNHTIGKLNTVSRELANEGGSGLNWSELTKECLYWDWCKYCKHQNLCLENFGDEFGKVFMSHDKVRKFMTKRPKLDELF